jgi:23S rRNA pseudouridine955/2504/2580 synthase
MKIFEIRKNDSGQRLDKFLSKAVKAMPPSLMYKSIRTKKIKVNRKRAEISQILNEGDTVQLFLPSELFDGEKDESKVLSHITPTFNVIYEDENIILADKPSGLTVQPDTEGDTNTLITQIQAYLYKKGEYDPSSEQSFSPALCNRIDRNTAGIVIAAKNAEALRCMNEVIKERRLTKKYLCAVHGSPSKKESTLRGFLFKNSKTNTVTVYDEHVRGSKEILTKYKVIAENNDTSLLEVELLTGRTHQIRAHMASIGHPLLGDGKYGVNRDDKKSGYKYQALCSYYLRFDDDGFFSYLKGKEFTVDAKSVFFLDIFENDTLPKRLRRK